MSRRLDPENFCAEKLAWHKRIMRDPAVSRSAKSVVSLLVHDLNPCVGGAWRGQDSMAASLGLSDRQLRRLLKQLETAAYLQIEVRKGRSRTNIYRATLPDAAAEVSEKRTPASSQPPKNRTPTSRKPDMDVRQFPYDPIRRSRAAESQQRDVVGTPAQVVPFAQADIRQAVVQIVGEAATVSYLDRAIWEPDGQRIVCFNSTAYGRLKDLVGRPLAERGVSIALHCEATRLAA